MRGIYRYELKKTLHRKDAVALILLGLWPVLVTVCCHFGSGLFNFSGDPMGAFEFVNMLLAFQDMLFLPVLIGVYIAAMSFYQEIHTRSIYVYKDLPRGQVLRAKYLSVYTVYAIFLVTYIVLSFVFYYLLFQYQDMATGTLVAYPDNVLNFLYNTFEITISVLFYIHVGITLSLRTSTGMALVGTSLFYMFTLAVPNLSWFKYIFPVGYKNVIEVTQHPYIFCFVMSILVWTVYNVVLYRINLKKFRQMEFC